MAIDFPASPSTNQVYTYQDKSWSFDGTAWVSAVALNTDTDWGLVSGSLTTSYDFGAVT